MRHALVPVHLIHSARTAAATTYARYDADPELEEVEARRIRRSRSRSRRLAARTRRAHA
jgi:hypothetical protein